MPIFNFHVEDGTIDHPYERIDLPTLDAARAHAAALCGVLIRDGEGRFAHGESWQLRVTDEAGLVCLSLTFTAAAAAAAGINSYRALLMESFARGAGDEVTLGTV